MILFPLLAALLASSSLRRVLRLIAGLALLVLWPGQINSTHDVNAPAKFLTGPDGAPARGPNNEMILKNWSGYAVTSGGYKSASASWTVPQVAFMSYPGGPSVEASATWVGIGGLSTSDLIQLGTGQIVAPNGATTYYAWYELLPATQVPLPAPYNVSPGDAMSAALNCTANCTANNPNMTWRLSMTDSTKGWTSANTVTYPSNLSSAEWIQEASTGPAGLSALPDYSPVPFTNLVVNGENPNLMLSANGLVLNDPAGGNSTPCAAVNGNEFTVVYGTSCTSNNIALATAVLPLSRSVEIGNTATAFATLINAGSGNASTCSIAPATSVPASFVFQTTNPATNALTGTANTPVNIAPGASQSYVIAFTPSAAFSPTNIQLNFSCANAGPAPVIVGINTLNLSASSSPVPDIVALAASGDPGYVDIPGAAGTGVFAVATVNLGSDATITASANTGTANLPVALTICQTDPTSGACLAAPGPSVATDIPPNATPTFGIFVTGSAAVANSPGVNRVFVAFTDSGGMLRGETSVAVRTQ
jgi:hypothetical protein